MSDLSIPDISMRAVIPMFPESHVPCTDIWKEKFEKGVLSCMHFKSYWRVWVPTFFSPETNGNLFHWSYDEERAKKIFFHTLENFICGDNNEDIFEKINMLENPSPVCGRVFKIGEPAYSCRECGMGSTCVLCVECFKKSAHRYHKYKMGTSCRGRCCDCGDVQAWKSDPFCDIHVNNPESSKKTKQQLPQDLLERARVVFIAVLKYAYQLLTLEHSPGLQSDLRIKEGEEDPLGLFDTSDIYCMVLYNDQIHTFEHMITALQRVLKINQKDAVEYVININREGRAVVKFSTFQVCTELKNEIERITSRYVGRPLRVLVVHGHIVAHQFYAIKLLNWLQNILSYSESFCELFADIVMNTKIPDISLIEGILLQDSQLWTSARSHWHKLVITGMLMNYESKKTFAKIFTKYYGTVVKDFIRDDHDHSYSVASLSVRLFTVPTLAHYLIANEDVLSILFNTFISQFSPKLNEHGKLEFKHNSSRVRFERAQYILYDLQYLLSAKPLEWTDSLRTGFLQWFSLLLNLLCCMQGMVQVTRKIAKHMMYKLECEFAFDLHIMLAQVLSLALEWCGADRVVFVKAYCLVMKKLHENISIDTLQVREVRELAGHRTLCFLYDVSTQPISIHLPLSRFLAGLHLYLEKFGYTFYSPELEVHPKPSPEQIIENVMRTQVLIAQVHAGMWNGNSLQNQLFFYHSLECRSEMLDKDIILLQIGACLIESNEFLIHLLNKFNLLNWAHPDFEKNSLKSPEEDSMHQTINLVEEFLGLLVMLIGERHVPGIGKVGSDDQIKKEIIQQLCIKPVAHSELNRALPKDANHETGMERVINELAEFKKPQGSGKGVYELKPQFFNQYNVFFYHYTREEQSKSEESQRNRRKATGDLDCCPPPLPPPFTDMFIMLCNLLQCDVMLHIMHTVLSRSLNLQARSFSEVQLHKVLHIIGYALLEEETQQCQFLTFTEHAEKLSIEELIEKLCSSPRVESHKDLLTWTLTKYQKVAGPHRQNVSGAADVAFEVTPTKDSLKDDKEWRAKMAVQKREKVMAQMMTMQKSFMKEKAKFFESTSLPSMSEVISRSAMDLSECSYTSPVALGASQSTRINLEKTYTCILCRENQTVSASAPILVFAAFVQQSSLLCQRNDSSKLKQDDNLDLLYLPATLGPAPHISTCGHVMHRSCWQKCFVNIELKESRKRASFYVDKQEFLCPLCQCLSNTVLPLVPPLGILNPPSANTYNIDFESWIQALKVTLKYKRKISSDGKPVVKNATLPPQSVTPPTSSISSIVQVLPSPMESITVKVPLSVEVVSGKSSNSDESESKEAIDEEAESSITSQIFYTCPLDQVVAELGKVGERFSQLFSGSVEGPKLSDNLSEMVLLFSQAIYTKGLNVNQNFEDPRVPLMVWKSCAYTIHSIERVLRELKKPLLGDLSSRQQACLESFVHIVGVLGTVWNQSEIITNHALCLISTILDGTSDGPCIFDWDCFGILLPLALSLPSLFLDNKTVPIITGNVQDLYVLKVLFFANIVKILLTLDFYRIIIPMDIEDDNIAVRPLFVVDALNAIRNAAGLNKVEANAQFVWSQVREDSVPFLRCCTLFYHFLTNVPAPKCLMEIGGDTFENLCSYLGLPTSVEEIFNCPIFNQLMIKWSEHKKVKSSLFGINKALVAKPSLPLNTLISLPEDYSEVLNTVSSFNCPNTHYDETRIPTMCLLCGQILCSQSYCCQTEVNKVMIGACTNHAYACGAGVGIYLRVRECEVLLLAAPNQGCFIMPPYLDEYGETDQGLRRGNPLHLCQERYKKLQLLWMNHGIYEEIAHALETNGTHLAIQWHRL